MGNKHSASNGKYRLVIQHDDDATSPREHDNLGTMVCWHRRYDLGDKKIDPPESDHDIPDEHIVLPLYLYDHSGLTISTKAFSCGFDSGQVGWIYMTADKVREYLDLKDGEPIVITRAQHESMLDCLRAEVAEYDTYLRGDVWGFNVYKLATCDSCGHTEAESDESCWGFFNVSGDDAKEAIADHLNDEVRPLLDEAWENRNY